jgi:protoporphyrinogen oxidase
MVLCYLELEQDQFTEFDAHYFPGEDLLFTRISEPKNYTDRNVPSGKTVLCAEIPCFRDDKIWSMPEHELSRLVIDGLAKAGLPVQSKVSDVKAVHIPFAYPLYRTGYEKYFEIVDSWVDGLEGILSFGRQGLYVHDNTHHAIYMAMSAVSCLQEDAGIDIAAWKQERKIFESHVVED